MIIKDGILFHNVEELEETPEGFRMWRLPKDVRNCLNPGIYEPDNCLSTGIELRFQMLGDGVDLYLRADTREEASVAHIYYGSVQGGWRNSTRMIWSDRTKIHIDAPDNMDELKQLTKENHFPFSPEVVRVVLPYTRCFYLGVEGEVAPPRPDQLPEKTYLAYGSSITHGSLALVQPYTYPFRIAQLLGTDYLNYGFAGSAKLEPEIAEYICSRKDWSFASLELGINVLKMDEDEFARRTDFFTARMAEDPRPVFATSVFKTLNNEPRAQLFREIVGRYAKDRLIFTEGLDLLGNRAWISQDGVHPTLEGIASITENWSRVMKENMSL